MNLNSKVDACRFKFVQLFCIATEIALLRFLPSKASKALRTRRCAGSKQLDQQWSRLENGMLSTCLRAAFLSDAFGRLHVIHRPAMDWMQMMS